MSSLNHASFIWGIAEKLRGPFKRHEYGKVILPFVVLRRLDCALESTKSDVLTLAKGLKHEDVSRDFQLQKKSGYSFYNTSPYDLQRLQGDPTNLKANMQAYIAAFSPNLRDVFERYDFDVQLGRLEEEDLLLLITQEFLKIDLHPDAVDNTQMGHIFEELIAKSMEASNEEAGEYFTPRDVVRLMVNLLFTRDDKVLSKTGVVRSVYDPTAGTGGMLSVAEDHLRSMNPDAQLTLYGQERNAESYAIAKTDLLIKGQSAENMFFGDTLTNDGHWDKTFDYGLANPPFGVEWKKQQDLVTREHDERGFNGRFGAGLPRVSDGSLLFLLHLISKMRPVSEGGGRVAIVFNGSPLFTGSAGSGESEIRRWILENDLLEAIVALPRDMFYNTPISTYIWILDNDKPKERGRKVQLIDGSSLFKKLRKGVGNKRNEITPEHVSQILRSYDSFEMSEISKIFSVEDFKYTEITIEQPLRRNWAVDEARIQAVLADTQFQKLSAAKLLTLESALRDLVGALEKPTWDGKSFTESIGEAVGTLGLTATQKKNLVNLLAMPDPEAPEVQDSKGQVLPDPDLRDWENVPWSRDLDEYVQSEVAPYLDNYSIDRSKDKIGYDIPFTRHFYKYFPPRTLGDIDSDLSRTVSEISELLKAVEGIEEQAFHEVTAEGTGAVGVKKEIRVPSFALKIDAWATMPVRNILRLHKEQVGTKWNETQLLSLTKQGVIDRDIDSGIGKFPESFDNYQIVQPGDLVFCLFDVEETPRTIGLVRNYGMITSAYTRAIVDKQVADPRYLEYLFVYLDNGKRFKPFYNGLRNTIQKEIFRATRLSLPPLVAQTQIANFLDEQLGRIAILQAKAEELANLLSTRAESIIAEATTGLIEVK